MLPADFAGRVWIVCNRFGGSITSWQRTPKHNTAVGGVAGSPHVYGVGADVVYDEVPPLGFVETYSETLGLEVIREKDHDHFQPIGWRHA